MKAGGLGILLVSAALLPGCSPKSSKETKAVSIGWRPIGIWSGRGNEQTDSFEIGSGQFRVKWETKNESAPGAGTFRVTARSAVSGRPIAPVVDYKGVGQDTAYVSDDPRPYFLEIESANVDWSVTVQEAVGGTPEGR